MSKPIMVSSHVLATTAKEASFRLDYPLAFARSTRVIAFDDAAEAVVRRIADNPWGQAQFYTVSDTGVELFTLDGETRLMEAEIEHSDSIIFVATNGIKPDATWAVGKAAWERSIMTAGLLMLNEGDLESSTLAAIRPHCRILLVPADEDDLFQLLVAIRA
ncbi:hypothetical protein B5M43_011225 [Microbacterium sp. MEC084]|uniref:hypothetical protein n=1 Tax=unclassified Microbacterium TaxID=2609290 RepID=UPI0006FE810A|nr:MULTISPECIES: hypothetical protein [unclassified Microbacterium]KQZ11721.1 hypothetical protein ASD19_00060 [Microbacterium sp. Root53]MCD1269403.1 hypothetical protein [Microbacterium sp. MEC084]